MCAERSSTAKCELFSRIANIICSSKVLLSALCDAYEAYALSGDMCHRLCHTRNWSFISLHQDGGTAIIMGIGDQKIVLKSQYATIDQFDELEPDGSEEEFTNAVCIFLSISPLCFL